RWWWWAPSSPGCSRSARCSTRSRTLPLCARAWKARSARGRRRRAPRSPAITPAPIGWAESRRRRPRPSPDGAAGASAHEGALAVADLPRRLVDELDLHLVLPARGRAGLVAGHDLAADLGPDLAEDRGQRRLVQV